MEIYQVMSIGPTPEFYDWLACSVLLGLVIGIWLLVKR